MLFKLPLPHPPLPSQLPILRLRQGLGLPRVPNSLCQVVSILVAARVGARIGISSLLHAMAQLQVGMPQLDLLPPGSSDYGTRTTLGCPDSVLDCSDSILNCLCRIISTAVGANAGSCCPQWHVCYRRIRNFLQ